MKKLFEKLNGSFGLREVFNIKYFVNETDRKASRSSCYFEFQKGRYNGNCWLQDSLSISDDLWEDLNLSDLFGEIIPKFAYYGCTTVTQKEWVKLLKRAEESGCLWKEVIEELVPWANECFENNDVFTILGI